MKQNSILDNEKQKNSIKIIIDLKVQQFETPKLLTKYSNPHISYLKLP